MRQFFSQMGFWGRTLSLLFMMLAFTIISVVVGDISAVLIFGKDDMAHSTVPVLLFLQFFISTGLFVLPAGVLCWVCRDGSPMQRLGISPRPGALSIIICVAVMIVSIPFIGWLEEVNLTMTLPDSLAPVENWMRAREDEASAITRKLIGQTSPLIFVCDLLVLALMPAVGEELTFRLGIQQAILGETTRMGKYWAAILTAVIFSAIHFQFFGFWPRMVLGAFLGVMMIETRGILCSMAAHFVNNAIAVSMGFAEARGCRIDISPFTEHPVVITASAIGCVALLLMLHQNEKKVSK